MKGLRYKTEQDVINAYNNGEIKKEEIPRYIGQIRGRENIREQRRTGYFGKSTRFTRKVF